MKKYVILIFLFLSFIKTVVACELENNNSLHSCLNTAFSIIEMDICFGTENDSCDKLLNDEYKKAMERADNEQKIKLRDMERLWLKFVELHCSIDVDFNGRESKFGYNNCKILETKKRIKELKQYFIYEDGTAIK